MPSKSPSRKESRDLGGNWGGPNYLQEKKLEVRTVPILFNLREAEIGAVQTTFEKRKLRFGPRQTAHLESCGLFQAEKRENSKGGSASPTQNAAEAKGPGEARQPIFYKRHLLKYDFNLGTMPIPPKITS